MHSIICIHLHSFTFIHRPSGAFVAKTYKTHEVQGTETKDKVFLNIVYSDKIAVPTKTTSKEGTYWSVPYSLGPPHMEKVLLDAN